MKVVNLSNRMILLAIVCIVVRCAFGAETEITRLSAVSDGEAVRITIELTSPVKPVFWALEEPSRLIFDFPNVALETQIRRIPLNHSGVGEVRAEMIHGTIFGARISVHTDRLPRFGMTNSGNTVVLTILPQPWEKNAGLKAPIDSKGIRETIRTTDAETKTFLICFCEPCGYGRADHPKTAGKPWMAISRPERCKGCLSPSWDGPKRKSTSFYSRVSAERLHLRSRRHDELSPVVYELGYRFDEAKKNPQHVQSLLPRD